MTKLFLLILLFVPFFTSANDGAYYASGNQLIPIFETDISVKKEILTIKKRNGRFIEVTVYYEFFNPKAEKEILVGFEAFSPQGDVEPSPVNGEHPYMYDFTVNMNGNNLPFDIAYLSDSIVTDGEQIKSLDLRKITDEDQYFDQFYYVYHFKAKFKKGLNKIVHTYTFDASSSVAEYFNFDYVLTAANSWANKQIDDFTLILDLGECEEFNLGKTFFDDASEWVINGLGKMSKPHEQESDYRDFDNLYCVVQKGNLVFQKQNFHPKGELYIWLMRQYFIAEGETDYKPSLCYSYHYQNEAYDADASDLEKKIMRNLPFARRGYIFQNAAIQKFYAQQRWYIPNPHYFSNVDLLHPLEREWLEKYE